ncbi:MAG: glycine cleavage T C-terminal barrel domain-containing protein, partial [Oscillospiraceae bacterium]
KYKDISDSLGQIALQGPQAEAILREICNEQYIPVKYYHFVKNGVLHLPTREITAIISKTGYTGERGYELYCNAEDTQELWNTLLSVGTSYGLIPCGLGARDTLRLEAGMPLYGHEMNDDISPLEAGLPCKTDGKDFIGRSAILARGEPKMKRVGLLATSRGIMREHCDIYEPNGAKIGWVSSGTHCPFLGKSVAMGYLPTQEVSFGKKVTVDVRGRMIEAEIVSLPFYKVTK